MNDGSQLCHGAFTPLGPFDIRLQKCTRDHFLGWCWLSDLDIKCNWCARVSIRFLIGTESLVPVCVNCAGGTGSVPRDVNKDTLYTLQKVLAE